MKLKLFVFLSLLFSITGIISAEENIDFSFQMGNYGFGLNFSPEANNLELSLGLVNIFLDNPKTNLGFKISPFNLYTNIEAVDGYETNSITYLSFVNLNMYWNCLNDNKTILGPFVSFEYITIRGWETFNFNDFTINTGIKFIYKRNDINFSFINYNSNLLFYCMELEAGYRYNPYDKNKFYITIKTDLLLSLLIFADILSLPFKIWFW